MDRLDDEEYWQRYAEVAESHGRILAAFESLRRDCLEAGVPVTAWALTLVEQMLCEFEFGTVEHSRVHNLAAEAIRVGVRDAEPPSAALLAYDVHAGDFNGDDDR